MGSYPQVGGQGEMLKAQLCPESRLPPLTPPAWLCPLCFSPAAAMIHSTFVGEFPLKCSHRTCGNAAVDPWCPWGALRLCLSPGSVLLPVPPGLSPVLSPVLSLLVPEGPLATLGQFLEQLLPFPCLQGAVFYKPLEFCHLSLAEPFRSLPGAFPVPAGCQKWGCKGGDLSLPDEVSWAHQSHPVLPSAVPALGTAGSLLPPLLLSHSLLSPLQFCSLFKCLSSSSLCILRAKSSCPGSECSQSSSRRAFPALQCGCECSVCLPKNRFLLFIFASSRSLWE